MYSCGLYTRNLFFEEKSATLSLLFLCLHYLYCAPVRCRMCIRRCWLNYTAPPASTAAGKLAGIDLVLRLRDPALGPGDSGPDMHHSRSLPTDQGDLRHHSCSCRRSAQGAPLRAARWKRLAAREAVVGCDANIALTVCAWGKWTFPLFCVDMINESSPFFLSFNKPNHVHTSRSQFCIICL